MAKYEVTTTLTRAGWLARITKDGEFASHASGMSEEDALEAAAQWIVLDELPTETRRYTWDGMKLVKNDGLYEVVGGFEPQSRKAPDG